LKMKTPTCGKLSGSVSIQPTSLRLTRFSLLHHATGK
jgi:hypothetical protein